jgi:hypothetical protein
MNLLFPHPSAARAPGGTLDPNRWPSAAPEFRNELKISAEPPTEENPDGTVSINGQEAIAHQVWNEDGTYHMMVLGTTGRGKSMLGDYLQANGHDVVEVPHQALPSSKPQEIRLPPVQIDELLSLPVELFEDAVSSVHDILGCEMTREAVCRFLSESRLGAKILWLDEVETEIQDEMYEALGEFLTGSPSWIGHGADWDTRALLLRAAARARGYLAGNGTAGENYAVED